MLGVLEKQGLEGETVVFFASDNGASNEGGHSYRSLFCLPLFRSLFLSRHTLALARIPTPAQVFQLLSPPVIFRTHLMPS